MVQLSGNEFYVLALFLSWTLGFLPLFLGKRWTWVQCVGLALVLHPFVRMAITFLRTYESLFTPTVLQPASPVGLWLSVERNLWYDLALPLLGLFLMHAPYADMNRDTPLRRERFADALAYHGVAPRAGVTRDLQRGLSLFAFIALGYLAAYALSLVLAPIVQPADDESLYWRNITIPLILMLSLAAGLGEEFLFRGILLTWLARTFGGFAARAAWLPFALAALVQAVAFGLIHAGYGTILHVVGPALFGLAMAWVARHLGVLVTALLHAQINVVFFTVDVAPTYLAVNGAVGLVSLLSVSAALLALCAWGLLATRAEAVRILWRDVLRAVGVRRGEPPAAGTETPRVE